LVRSLIIVSLLLLLPLLAGAEEDGYDKILKRFEDFLKSSSMERRVRAFDLLDLENPRSLPPLRKLLMDKHWFMRGLAAESLAGVVTPALRAELRLDLITHEEYIVREGVALAFALAPEKGDAEALVEALADGDWRVRRMAAIALREIVSKESLEALIATLKKEKDPRVAVNIAHTLRSVTGQNFGRDGKKWADWWERNKDTAALSGLEEEVKRRKLGKLPLETVTMPPRRSPTGKPLLDIFVLAPLGWTHEVYRPYLDDLTKYARVTYVRLPRVQDLTGQTGYSGSAPTYPVGDLVRALEELRVELGKNRVVLLAEGATGWIAERYAIQYKKRTAAVVILNGFIDVRSYALALGRLARSPNPAERWVAQTLTNQNDVEHNEAAHRQIARIMLTSDLMDSRDSNAFLLWTRARDPQGFVTVPDLRFNPRAKIETPILFFFGGAHRLSGYAEAEFIRRHFPNNVMAVMHESRGFPYISEYAEFYRIIEGFLDYHGLR
jgi:pimeloyl-ACP methyl ester carboxylesterase